MTIMDNVSREIGRNISGPHPADRHRDPSRMTKEINKT